MSRASVLRVLLSAFVRALALSLSLAVALALPSAASAYHLDDPLIGGTTGTAEGGSFGPDGWTVTAPTDRLWFAVPEAATGSIEFTVSNVTNASLFPGDNDIFNLYDAADSAEPIPYRPDFVENNYKVWIRIRNEPGYYGNQKLTVAVCPDDGVAHSPVCACGPFFVEESTSGDPTWDGTPQRLRLTWDGASVAFFRNDVEVTRIDYSATGYDWGPRDLHFSIGTTRSRAVGTSGMPVGAVISNLVVDTTAGPVATCPGPPPPVDAGVCDPAALAATGDVTAASWETGVYSVPADLNVEAETTGAPTAIVYVRFPAVPRAARAILRTHTHADGSAGGGSGEVCRVDGAAWDETTLTWASRPAVSTVCSGGARAVTPNSEMEWDVTSLLTTTGDQSFAIVSTDSDGAHYLSRESGGCTGGPRLYIDPAPPEPDTGVAPPDGATADDGGTTGMDAAGLDAAGTDTGPSSGMDAGPGGRRSLASCGCRAARPTDGAALAPIAGVVMALAAVRRARRRSA